jgi:hypothetical protein
LLAAYILADGALESREKSASYTAINLKVCEDEGMLKLQDSEECRPFPHAYICGHMAVVRESICFWKINATFFSEGVEAVN